MCLRYIFVCPHTAPHAHTAIYSCMCSSYYYTLVYMCPHTAGMEGSGVADGVRPCCTFGYTNYAVMLYIAVYMCPHTTIHSYIYASLTAYAPAAPSATLTMRCATLTMRCAETFIYCRICQYEVFIYSLIYQYEALSCCSFGYSNYAVRKRLNPSCARVRATGI
jgi:hypothetical protein